MKLRRCAPACEFAAVRHQHSLFNFVYLTIFDDTCNTHTHTHTQTQTHTHRGTHTHTQTQTHTKTQTHTHTCSEQSLRIRLWSASYVQKTPTIKWQDEYTYKYRRIITVEVDHIKQQRWNICPPQLRLICAQGRDNIYIYNTSTFSQVPRGVFVGHRPPGTPVAACNITKFYIRWYTRTHMPRSSGADDEREMKVRWQWKWHDSCSTGTRDGECKRRKEKRRKHQHQHT